MLLILAITVAVVGWVMGAIAFIPAQRHLVPWILVRGTVRSRPWSYLTAGTRLTAIGRALQTDDHPTALQAARWTRRAFIGTSLFVAGWVLMVVATLAR